MLGYNLNSSSEEIYNQYIQKITSCDKKYKDEINFGYIIVSDPQVIKAYQAKVQEGWKHLEKCMKIPPTILINNFVNESKNLELVRPVHKHKKAGVLHCYLCEVPLTDNILHKIKFMEIRCNCNNMFSHTKCGNDFIMKYTKCDVCKKYYDITPHCSSLRAIL